jgi:hypothetical protein
VSNRYAQCDILVGVNGTGKTTLLKDILRKVLEKGDRALVVTPDPIEWNNIPEINYRLRHHIKNYTGIRKIVYYSGCMDDIQQYYANGVLVFDDARVYINAQTNSFMEWLQIRRRQAGIDLLCVFHGLTQVPPVFFTFTSNLFLFHTLDNIKRRSVYIDDLIFEEIQDAKKEIQSEVSNGDIYYYKRVIFDKRFKFLNNGKN